MDVYNGDIDVHETQLRWRLSENMIPPHSAIGSAKNGIFKAHIKLSRHLQGNKTYSFDFGVTEQFLQTNKSCLCWENYFSSSFDENDLND